MDLYMFDIRKYNMGWVNFVCRAIRKQDRMKLFLERRVGSCETSPRMFIFVVSLVGLS